MIRREVRSLWGGGPGRLYIIGIIPLCFLSILESSWFHESSFEMKWWDFGGNMRIFQWSNVVLHQIKETRHYCNFRFSVFTVLWKRATMIQIAPKLCWSFSYKRMYLRAKKVSDEYARKLMLRIFHPRCDCRKSYLKFLPSRDVQ